MRRFLLLLVTLFISHNLHAQWFKTYRPGYYYNRGGKKILGLLSFQTYNDFISFKVDKSASSEKISLDDISSVVFTYNDFNGTDSLTVLSETDKKNKRYLAKFKFGTAQMTFYYRFIEYNVGGTPEMTIRGTPNMSTGSQPAFHNTMVWRTSPAYSGTREVIMYRQGDASYELTKKNYVTVLSEAFADVPEIAQKLRNNEFKFSDLNEIFNQYDKEHEHNRHKNVPVTIKLDSAG